MSHVHNMSTLRMTLHVRQCRANVTGCPWITRCFNGLPATRLRNLIPSMRSKLKIRFPRGSGGSSPPAGTSRPGGPNGTWHYGKMRMDYRDVITIEPGKRRGEPCIRGLRITVYDVLDFLAAGMSVDQLPGDWRGGRFKRLGIRATSGSCHRDQGRGFPGPRRVAGRAAKRDRHPPRQLLDGRGRND